MDTDGQPIPFVPAAEFTKSYILTEWYVALRNQNPLLRFSGEGNKQGVILCALRPSLVGSQATSLRLVLVGESPPFASPVVRVWCLSR